MAASIFNELGNALNSFQPVNLHLTENSIIILYKIILNRKNKLK